jgi:hypothetical protein
MTAIEQRQTSVPRVSGDERFVPVSHLLVADQRVSHAAFRLWCVLHRLWFLHEPPTMELLQDMMGTFVATKEKNASRTSAKIWQPATRRSIERWLTELEAAGWLIWTRREETSRRYHLRTSAQSAIDAAVLTDLRRLLNSGKATLADIQALVQESLSDDATIGSHDPTDGSHQEEELSDEDTTTESYGRDNTTTESHHATTGSQGATVESHGATLWSHHATAGSHHATLPSHQAAESGILMREKSAPIHEIFQTRDLPKEITSPPQASTGEAAGDDGPTATERFLLRQGFSARVAREFRQLDPPTVQADFERRIALGQGIGAIVTVWRITPPQPEPVEPSSATVRSGSAKAQALAIAPPGASALDVQYLALDLEEGLSPAVALQRLAQRRVPVAAGGAR